MLVSRYSDSIGPIMTAALRAGSALNQSSPNTPRPRKKHGISNFAETVTDHQRNNDDDEETGINFSFPDALKSVKTLCNCAYSSSLRHHNKQGQKIHASSQFHLATSSHGKGLRVSGTYLCTHFCAHFLPQHLKRKSVSSPIWVKRFLPKLKL